MFCHLFSRFNGCFTSSVWNCLMICLGRLTGTCVLANCWICHNSVAIPTLSVEHVPFLHRLWLGLQGPLLIPKSAPFSTTRTFLSFLSIPLCSKFKILASILNLFDVFCPFPYLPPLPPAKKDNLYHKIEKCGSVSPDLRPFIWVWRFIFIVTTFDSLTILITENPGIESDGVSCH